MGTYPNILDCPPIPYDYFSSEHLAFDVIYNPPETALLKQARLKGAKTKNELEMLEIQAKKNWKIWNKSKLTT